MPVPYLPWMQPAPPQTPVAPPAAFQPKPSILDRVMARLFPATQMLSPDIAPQVGAQARTQLAANLLYAGGASPQQRGTLSNIGAAIGGVDVDTLMKNALALQQYKQQQQTSQAIGQVLANAPTGGTAHDRFVWLSDALAKLGVPDALTVAEKLAPLITATKPPTASGAEWSSPLPGADEHGRVRMYQVNRDTGEIRWLHVGVPPKEPKEPTPVERTAGSQYTSAAASVAKMRDIATRNPDAAKAAVAAVQAGGWGKLGKAYAALRGFTNDPDAQEFYTEYKNMILTVTPTYGSSRPTQQLMDLEQAATLPALGSGDFDTAFRHMEQRLNDLKAKAGRGLTTDQKPRSTGYRPGNPFAPQPTP